MTSRILLLAFAAVGSATAANCNAAERLWVKYSEIAELYEKFQTIPAERRADLDFRVKLLPLNKAPLTGITLQLRSRAGNSPIDVGSDGVINFPIEAVLRKEDPPLYINSPEQVKVALGLDVRIRLPQRLTLSYAEAMESVQLAGEGLRKHAGIWAFFMPNPDGLELRFPANEVNAVRTRDGGAAQSWLSDAAGVVLVPLTKEMKSDNPTLVLPRAPLEARPHFKEVLRLIPDGEASAK